MDPAEQDAIDLKQMLATFTTLPDIIFTWDEHTMGFIKVILL